MIYISIWTHGEENHSNFMKNFNNSKSNLKFTFECDRNSINFLDLNFKLNYGVLTTSFCIKPTDRHQYPNYLQYLIRTILKLQLSIARIYGKLFMFI